MIDYNIVATGSKGNCVIYSDSNSSTNFMVDLGIPFKDVEIYLKEMDMILLTHKHGDHFDKATITRIGREYPNIILVVPDHMVEEVKELNYAGQTFVIETGRKFKYSSIIIETVNLFHDVPNVGYKIITTDNFKLIHATDTGSILHVKAKNYDLYAIEFNYKEQDLEEKIQKKINDGLFAYEIRSKENHLSFDQADSWIESQRKKDSKVIKLHISSTYLE